MIYGLIGLFIRYVEMPSEAIAMYRGLLGAAFLLVYMKCRGMKLDTEAIRRNLKWLVLSGVCLGLNWLFLFGSYTQTTVAIGSLCNYTAPMIVVLIAPLVLGVKFEVRKLPFILLSFAGVVLISGVFDGGAAGGAGEYNHVLGVVLGLGASLAFVGILICNKKFEEIGFIDRAFMQLAVSACVTLPYTAFMNKGIPLPGDLQELAAILTVGIVFTGCAYIFFFTGVGSLPVETIAILGYLEPVVAILSSLVFLHEPMTLFGWAGAALILGSAVITELMPEQADRS